MTHKPTKCKPVKAWAIKQPDRCTYPVPYFEPMATEDGAKSAAYRRLFRRSWDDLYEEGYRCVPVLITEATHAKRG